MVDKTIIKVGARASKRLYSILNLDGGIEKFNCLFSHNKKSLNSFIYLSAVSVQVSYRKSLTKFNRLTQIAS